MGFRVAPFAVAAAAIFALNVPAALSRPGELAVAGGTMAAVVVGALAVPWDRLAVGAQCSVPLSFYLVIVVLRDAAGGTYSSAGTLALLPVAWAALYGSGRALGAALGATAAVFVAPVCLISGRSYPGSDLARGAAVLTTAVCVGIVLQRSIRALAAERSAAETARNNLSAVAEMMRGLHDGEDVRAVICEGALRMAGAVRVLLVEPRDGTATVGADAVAPAWGPGRPHGADRAPDGATLPPAVAELCRAGRRYRTDQPPGWLQGTGEPASPLVRSVVYQPVMWAGSLLGVLVVAWSRALAVDDPAVDSVAVVASEAGAALRRTDLIHSLDRRARTDGLTALANRRSWDETLACAIGAASAPLCVALMDLDRFKAYNDTYGHQAGDRLLRAAAQAWSGRLRQGDTLARYGGEEFAVALPGCRLEEAIGVIAELAAATPDGQTVSAGVAEWDGSETGEDLLQRADRALYGAKRSGRNRVQADPGRQHPVRVGPPRAG